MMLSVRENSECYRRKKEANKIRLWLSRNMHNHIDGVIFVSCIYNKEKEEEARAIITELSQSYSVYLIGCFPDAFPKETFPNVTKHPLKGYEQFLDNEFKLPITLESIRDFEVSNNVTIALGYTWKCAYCAIRHGTGNGLTSVPLDKIEDELNTMSLDNNVLLLGEDTGLWGIDLGQPFCALTDMLLKTKFIFNFDNMSAQMFLKNFDSFKSLADHGKLSSITIGVQHFSNDVLKEMNRPEIDFFDFEEGVKALIESGVSIYFYLMSGFPSETSEQASYQRKCAERYRRLGVIFYIFDFHRKIGTNIIFPDIEVTEKKERLKLLLGCLN
jgi:tRNA A37 methylthiotransferase MiaB